MRLQDGKLYETRDGRRFRVTGDTLSGVRQTIVRLIW